MVRRLDGSAMVGRHGETEAKEEEARIRSAGGGLRSPGRPGRDRRSGRSTGPADGEIHREVGDALLGQPCIEFLTHVHVDAPTIGRHCLRHGGTCMCMNGNVRSRLLIHGRKGTRAQQSKDVHSSRLQDPEARRKKGRKQCFLREEHTRTLTSETET